MDETDQESLSGSLISNKMTKEEEVEQQKDTFQSSKEREEETTKSQHGGDGDEDIKERKNEKQCHPGILYLGHIPPMLRPKHLRKMLSVYGEIGRIFMQPEDRQVRRKKRKSGSRRSKFVEGWVEFRDKRIAKRVAVSLHNTPMGTKRRQMFFTDLWNMKYLHRFQWTHLNERLAFEQTVLQQRLRAEVSQAKRETNFYLNNVEKSAHLDKVRKKRQRDGEQVDEKRWEFTQRPTEEEFQKRKKAKSIAQKHLDKARLLQEKSQSNASLLVKIFNSNPSE